ncbi:MAG TPA: methyltransferase domain-containing protein [Myxococcota bacterium]
MERRRTDSVRVQQGRRGRALRIDGTLASWYAPGSPLTGSVWDALALPLLLLPPQRRHSVLILGLGGGSAARVARCIAPRARIVGIERSAEVLRAARRWFDLDALGVEVVRTDARTYLATTRRRFDAILEDIFVGQSRAVHKPEWLPEPGLARAARRLRRGGVLVSNAIDEAPAVARTMRRLFPATLCIDIAEYDNRIVVGGPGVVSGRALRAAAAAHPVLRATLGSLSFRTL